MLKRKLPLAIISSLLLALSMPKPGIWALAWLALIPLFVALRNIGSARAALIGFVAGIVYYGVILHWVTIFGYLPWVLLVIYSAAYIAVFGAVVSRLLPSRIGSWGYVAVPAAWTAIQWTRTLTAYSFPWASLAHIQANDLIVSQLASVTGPWGIDFLVCLVNLVLADLLIPYSIQRRCLPAVVTSIILIIVCTGGYFALKSPLPNGPKLRVAAIQGNMPNDVDPNEAYQNAALARYSSLSLQATRKHSDFVVWPETALSTIITGTRYEAYISQLAYLTDSNYLVGAYDAPDNPAQAGGYNGAHLFNRNGKKLGVYRKVRLVPFGEFVPLRDRLPFLKSYKIRDVDVLAAPEYRVLRTDSGKIGVAICFESMFPGIARQEVKHGANFVFIITNDAWFERSQAARQHLMMARLRAIENRRFVVRAADTGISALIDPNGRIIRELGIFRQGVVVGDVTPNTALTLYTRFGDYFAYACLGITLVFLLGAAKLLRAPKNDAS